MIKGTARASVVVSALVSVFLTCVVWGIFYFGFLREKWKLKQRVVAQLSKHEKFLAHLSHPENSDAWKNQSEQAIPNSADISDLLEAVSMQANLSGMVLVNFEEKPAQASGLVVEIPITVTLTGNYENLIQFIEALDGLSRLTTIKNMHLAVSTLSQDHAVLSITLTIVAYRGQLS